MARPDKAAAVAELAEEFRGSNGAVLTEYRGLSVKQLQELRRTLGDTASYSVVKNTLTRLAAREAGVEGLEDLLVGPSAIAFVKGDPVEAAKGLRDFARANAPLVIKGGVLDGRPLTPAEIARFADLESREVLLAKLAGAMTASLADTVSLLQAPIAQAARLAAALQAKVQDDPDVIGGAGQVATDEPTTGQQATGDSATDQQATDQQATDEPATDEPVTDRPLATVPTSGSPDSSPTDSSPPQG